MRTSKTLALLAEQERRFDRERADWRDERERLLDRIMHLAKAPMPDVFHEQKPPAPKDIFDADQTLSDDLYLPLDLPAFNENGIEGEYASMTISPRERMLREPD